MKLPTRTIAALYVARGGVYWGRKTIDAWDRERDARSYAGPHPVVAHPPCERWGRYATGGPSASRKRVKGDDGGCFAAALTAVRRYGGVLEHPEASAAWAAFGLNPPPPAGGWVAADWLGGWTCCVAQGHYGHAAEKRTWLYAFGVDLPSLKWGRCRGTIRLDRGFHSAEERRAAPASERIVERLSSRQRIATPLPFRNLLLGMAATAKANSHVDLAALQARRTHVLPTRYARTKRAQIDVRGHKGEHTEQLDIFEANKR
jgi:hypothetical protein